MKICKELIEKKHDEIIETMKKADAMAYRNTGCEYRVYIDTDGNVGREEWPANDNGYYSFRDSDYSREYLHTFCHQFYSVLWDGWFTSQAEFAEDFKGRFGVELESTDRYNFEADGEDTIRNNGLSLDDWAEWVEQKTEEAIEFFADETDYDEILNIALEQREIY